MNIFITGANGFIGSHLKEYLAEKYPGYTLYAPSSQVVDLYDENAVDDYISDRNIDIIIHLANKGGGRDTVHMKNLTEYNLRVFFNIAKHTKNVQKILSFGSGAEYGKHKPIVEAKEEDYWKALPLDEYGLYKAVTSRYIEQSHNIVQLRIFGAYGEYENYRYKFISNAIVKNLLHLPITIHQNVYFDYIYIQDLLQMIDWFIHNKSNEKIYNASSGTKVDLVTLAHTINEVSDFKSEIILLNDGLNHEYTSNNSKILEEIGPFHFTPHKEAIAKIRTFFSYNTDKLDCQAIKEDPYIKNINKIWKEEGICKPLDKS
jgi:GDP-L-fucose synthase